VIGVQCCAIDVDAAEKGSRAGAPGKLESAITGNFAGLNSLCTVGQTVLW